MERRDFLALLSSALLLPSTVRAAPAVTKLLVGATPGGGTDLVARSLAVEMEPRAGATYVVENRPGAAGNIAASAVANAAPDGGTLLLSYTSHAINPSLFKKLPFDAVKDFTPLCLVANSPLILVARPTLKARSLREVLALAKASPGKMSLAVAGMGSANHLAGEMLKAEAGVDIVSVPYKGASPAVTDVMGGQADLMLSNVATVQPLLQSGKLQGIAVSTTKRLAAYPDLPPIADVLPGFDYASWYGLFGPANMPAELVRKLERAAREAVQSPGMRKRLQSEGLDPIGSGSAEFTTFLRKEIERWAKVVAVTHTTIS